MSGQRADKGGRRPTATDPTEIAEILEYARLHDTAKAAEKYGCSVRTIRRWRAKVKAGKSPAVADLVTAQRKEMIRRSGDRIHDTLDQLLGELQERKVKLTNDELISAVEKVGNLRVTRDALTPHGLSADADQSGEGAPAGSEAAGERAGGGEADPDEGSGAVH